jgi:hypothetical protein
LAAWASALNDAGYWADVLDATWRYVFATDELLLSYREMGAATTTPIGSHIFTLEGRQFVVDTVGGAWASWDARRAWFLNAGRYVLGLRLEAARSFVASSIPHSRASSPNCNPKTVPPYGLG